MKKQECDNINISIIKMIVSPFLKPALLLCRRRSRKGERRKRRIRKMAVITK